MKASTTASIDAAVGTPPPASTPIPIMSSSPAPLRPALGGGRPSGGRTPRLGLAIPPSPNVKPVGAAAGGPSRPQLTVHVAYEKKTERLRLNGSHAAQLCDMKVRSPRTKLPLLQLMNSLNQQKRRHCQPLHNPDGYRITLIEAWFSQSRRLSGLSSRCSPWVIPREGRDIRE